MGDYKRLSVWRKARELTCTVYRVTRTFPRAEQFGLADQIRRAVISIGANIAEGCGRNSNAELRRFLHISLGSANELSYLLEVAVDLELIAAADAANLLSRVREVRRMLASLASAVHQGRRPSNEKSAAQAAPNPQYR